MSRFELLVFLHISAAIIWLGAGFLMAVLVLGAERAGNREKEAGHHQDEAWLAPRLFIPASLSVLVLGVLLVIDGPWSFDQLWIVLAFAGWAVSFLLGFFYFRPEGERIGELVEQRGPADPEVNRRIHRLNVIDRLQVLILFLVVGDMTLKPTGDDTGLFIAGAVILGTALILATASIRRATPAPAAQAAGTR